MTFAAKDVSVARGKKRRTLGDWMEEEMRKRRIGVNEFARLCGVSSGTISKYQRTKAPAPTMKFLRKLSKGTNTPLYTLVTIVDPSIEDETKIDPDALALAHRIVSFPEHTRNMLIGIVQSMHDTGDKD